MDAINALQCTCFDNGTKKRVVRHKLTVEAWTVGAENVDLRQNHAKAPLQLYPVFLDAIKRLKRRRSITPQHYDEMMQRLNPLTTFNDPNTAIMCALFGTKQGATQFLDRLWVLAFVQKRTFYMLAATVYVNDEGIRINGFTAAPDPTSSEAAQQNVFETGIGIRLPDQSTSVSAS